MWYRGREDGVDGMRKWTGNKHTKRTTQQKEEIEWYKCSFLDLSERQ
jgi:hypothetical protein